MPLFIQDLLTAPYAAPPSSPRCRSTLFGSNSLLIAAFHSEATTPAASRMTALSCQPRWVCRKDRTTTTLAGGALTVPSHYWKVLLILPNDDADDLPRITPDTRVIAVDIPNTQAASALPWGDYRTSVDAIEAATGLDLLNRIPAAVQAELEAGVDSGG
ncbi:MAG: DNA/RNA non-specific endonuclease [Flavobacteriales bacterium]|nr:DNA/RNA non-specific endonuclease [Flavobacteriales bacterium]